MLDMTKEEFMDSAIEIVREKTKEILKDHNEPELNLLLLLIGIDIAKSLTDKIYGEENNESQS